jgi:hypothetical protein
MLGGGHHRQGVAHVQFADQIQVKLETWNLEFRSRRTIPHVKGLHRIIGAEAKPLQRTGHLVQQRRQVGIVPVGQQQSVPRHQPDELPKRFLDRRQVLEDVGVIELQVVQDRRLRQVMDEFAALVEKCSVIFISFQDEPFTPSQMTTPAEVERQTANQVTGIQTRVLEHPGQQRRRSRLAVRPRHHHTTLAPQKELLQQLRHRTIRQLAVQNRLHLGIAPRQGVPYDDQVRPGRQVRLGIARHHLHTVLGQKCRHRRIGVLVRSRDGVALPPKRHGQ